VAVVITCHRMYLTVQRTRFTERIRTGVTSARNVGLRGRTTGLGRCAA
jgi:hypothetical protein